MKRFAILRVPGSGPPALAGTPNDFATEAEAIARIAEIEATQLKAHHTHLEVWSYEGPLSEALERNGILS